MTPEEFNRHVEEARAQRPQWFALPPDEKPTEAQIEFHQGRLGVRLPEAYLDFLRQEGGGDFAMVAVYSMDPASDLNIVRMNETSWVRREDFVAVSDDGAGDYYGFTVADGLCRPGVVLLDHESQEVGATGHADFFEFVVAAGLQR